MITVAGLSQKELIESFADLKQTELLTRTEITTLKSEKPEVRKHRIHMIAKNIKPSQTRGHNLNLRISRADKLWKSTWMSQRGVLLRHVGVQYDEEIVALANCVECPQIVVDFFINHGDLK